MAVESKRKYNQGRHGCDAADCHRKRHAQDGWEAATMGVEPVMQCLAGGSSGVPVFVQSGPAWPPNGWRMNEAGTPSRPDAGMKGKDLHASG